MLTKYFDAAMSRARYRKLSDDTCFGEIPGFDGLWANDETEEGCQEDLRSALEDWVLIAIRQNVPLPVVDGIDLNVRHVA